MYTTTSDSSLPFDVKGSNSVHAGQTLCGTSIIEDKPKRFSLIFGNKNQIKQKKVEPVIIEEPVEFKSTCEDELLQIIKDLELSFGNGWIQTEESELLNEQPFKLNNSSLVLRDITDEEMVHILEEPYLKFMEEEKLIKAQAEELEKRSKEEAEAAAKAAQEAEANAQIEKRRNEFISKDSICQSIVNQIEKATKQLKSCEANKNNIIKVTLTNFDNFFDNAISKQLNKGNNKKPNKPTTLEEKTKFICERTLSIQKENAKIKNLIKEIDEITNTLNGRISRHLNKNSNV